MKTKLYIENQLADLTEDLDASLTFAIDDIKDFSKRNTSFSKTIVIAGNDVNNKIFGHVFNLGSSNFYDSEIPNVGYNFNPAISARVVLLYDNIQVFKGSLRLTEVIQDKGSIEYECFIFGELGGFIFELGNKRLENLDFSEYDQTYSIDNITASWDNVSGGGVCYPLIDYGNVSTNKKHFEYKAFRPAFAVREILNKIIAGTSYTVQSNFFLDTLFNRLYVGNNQRELERIASDYFLGGTELNNMGYGEFPNYQIAFTSQAIGEFSIIDSGFTLRYNGATSITFTPRYKITGEVDQIYSGGPQEAVFVVIRKNGTGVDSVLLRDESFSGTSSFNLDVSFAPITLNTNDTITLAIPISEFNFVRFTLTSSSLIFGGKKGLPIPINLGETIPMNDVIPKGIFQKDFFISIVKMFNLYVYENPYDDKKIIITPFIDFYPKNSRQSLDWSGKIDRSKPIRSIPLSELNARYYRYKFKEDNDFYNEEYRKAYNVGYGDFIFDTEFEFSKDTEELTVIFSNSVLYQNVGEDKVFPAIYKLSGTTETPTEHNIRLYQLKKLSCNSWHIKNGATNLATQTHYLYAGHVNDPVNPTNDIGFGAPATLEFTPTGAYPFTNIFNSYHSAYLSEIVDKDSKLIKCYAYLTALDMANLDFSKLIYVDGVLFRLNKIIDFNPIINDVTEIELLKVIDL